MRHKVYGRKLNRDTNSRRRLFRALLCLLVSHQKLRTTLAKAKTVKVLAEKTVTWAKKKDVASLRSLEMILPYKNIRSRLTDVIAPRYSKRNGGCLRLIRLGTRRSDNTQMAELHWVEREEEKISLPGKAVKK